MRVTYTYTVTDDGKNVVTYESPSPDAELTVGGSATEETSTVRTVKLTGPEHEATYTVEVGIHPDELRALVGQGA